MIIFLYGPDSYRSRQKLNEIVDGYKKVRKSGLNLTYIDAKEKEFSDFYDSFKVASMFAETKLVIIKNMFSKKSFQEGFLDKVKEIESLKDIVVVYEEGEVDQRTKIFKTLTKECKAQEFSMLDTKNVKLWAKKEFDMLNQKINADALDLLVNYVGSDLWRFSNEIKKLANYAVGATVKREDVEILVRPKVILDIFKTIDVLAANKKQEALALLQKHLDEGDNALYLLSMIVYQFRTMLIIKELAEKGLMYNSIIKRSGLHPFVVKKNYFACSKFSLLQLKDIYKKIFAFDSDIKTGKIDQETALNLLIAQI